MEERSPAQSLANEEGLRLIARVWRFHAIYTFLGKPKMIKKLLLLVKQTTNS